jgi:hypothetical protein
MFKKILIIFLSTLAFSCTNVEKNESFTNETYEKIGFLGDLLDLKISDSKINVIVDKQFPGNTIKITNLINNKTETISNIQKRELDGSRIVYVSDSIKTSLDVNNEFPYIKIENSKLNPTFIANKAKIFKEEQKVPNTSKVSNVEVVSLSKKSKIKSSKIKNKIYLQYGSFYYSDYAHELNKNLKKFLISTDISMYGSKKKGYYVTIGPILNIKKFDEIFKLLKNNDYEGYEILVK